MTQIGRYRLDEVHGFGAFATVWRGFDPELQVQVAIKILAENWANHADVRARFLDEARLLRRIDHPRVVRVHDVGTHEDRPYFVMDFVAGGTLAARIDPLLPPQEALRLAAESARAVQVLHDEGVLHRDIKPTNFLVRVEDGGEHVLVSDLGSAKQLAEASGITVTTGTPAYMAPEQALGTGVDTRSDVYALGALTYHLLSGRLPYASTDVGAVMARTATTSPAPIGSLTGLGRSLDRVLASALATRPEDRLGSAARLAEALDDVADGQRVSGLTRARRDVPVWWAAALAVAGFTGALAVTALALR